jgi:hypothetical protein
MQPAWSVAGRAVVGIPRVDASPAVEAKGFLNAASKTLALVFSDQLSEICKCFVFSWLTALQRINILFSIA